MAFRDFSKYCFSFSLLDVALSEPKQQEKYFCRWMQKYAELFSNKDRYVGIEWDLRCRKATNEIFSSATFFMEAKKCYEMRCFSSYYFCMYYSLFHAIYSLLFLDNQSNMNKLLNITHRNLITTFVGIFANSSKDILSNSIGDFFRQLRYKRELYSYTVPFNNVFEVSNDLNQLELILSQCFQLCSFHSLMIEESYKKQVGKIIVLETTDELYDFDKLFNLIFSKYDDNNNVLLDSSAICLRNELMKYGFKPMYIALDLEHCFDEFHTYDNYYDGANEHAIKIADIWSFLYKTINEL